MRSLFIAALLSSALWGEGETHLTVLNVVLDENSSERLTWTTGLRDADRRRVPGGREDVYVLDFERETLARGRRTLSMKSSPWSTFQLQARAWTEMHGLMRLGGQVCGGLPVTINARVFEISAERGEFLVRTSERNLLSVTDTAATCPDSSGRLLNDRQRYMFIIRVTSVLKLAAGLSGWAEEIMQTGKARLQVR